MEKNKKHIAILFCIVPVFFSIFTGCVSNRPADETVIDYQRRITELETELNIINESIRISNSRLDEDISRLEDIRKQSSTITDQVDRIIYLFDQYESIVEQIIRDYTETRIKTSEN